MQDRQQQRKDRPSNRRQDRRNKRIRLQADEIVILRIHHLNRSVLDLRGL